jgi:hypothetical protein
MQHHRVCLIIALLAAAAAVPAVAQPTAPGLRGKSLATPAWSLLGECYPIDFTGIDVEWYPARKTYQLTVTGMKPYTNMEVSLSHESHSGRPAYWRTVVVGCVKNGLVMPIPSPYYVSMTLDQFVGSKGVEIVGASHSVRRAVSSRRYR